jgi:hypothetical protein
LLGSQGIGSYCLMGMRFPFGIMKVFLLHNTVNVLNSTELFMLRWLILHCINFISIRKLLAFLYAIYFCCPTISLSKRGTLSVIFLDTWSKSHSRKTYYGKKFLLQWVTRHVPRSLYFYGYFMHSCLQLKGILLEDCFDVLERTVLGSRPRLQFISPSVIHHYSVNHSAVILRLKLCSVPYRAVLG